MDDARRDTVAQATLAARESYGKLLAILAARTRNVAGAEDALADAFAAAFAQWPTGGVPTNPVGWLLTVARRSAGHAAWRGLPEPAGSSAAIGAQGSNPVP
jgi:RNA polymerase sigma-70 factor (ECF subfamily)